MVLQYDAIVTEAERFLLHNSAGHKGCRTTKA